jgi:hypothetical protein
LPEHAAIRLRTQAGEIWADITSLTIHFVAADALALSMADEEGAAAFHIAATECGFVSPPAIVSRTFLLEGGECRTKFFIVAQGGGFENVDFESGLL